MPQINYAPLPSLRDLHNSPARIKVACGPVGSGKSSFAVWEFGFQCLESPVPVRGIVLRESYPALRDSTVKTFMEWFGPMTEYKVQEKVALVRLPRKPEFGGGYQVHELAFRACQREEEATKFLSTEYSFAWLEECVPAYQQDGVLGSGLSEGIFKVVQMRIRQKGATNFTTVLTFNPPTPKHWVHERFFGKTPEQLEKIGACMVRSPARENEHNLRAGYYDELMEILDPDMARRFINGEVVSVFPGVKVYPEAIDQVHVVEEVLPVPGIPLILGFDYGLTPATLISQLTPLGQWRWLAELQSFNMGQERHAIMLKAKLQNEFKGYSIGRCYGDPAGNHRAETNEETAVQIYQSHGFRIVPGKQDLTSRLESIKQQLMRNAAAAQPAIVVSRSRCPTAAEGLLGGYRFPKNSGGQIGTEPLKNNYSHILNAAEYIATAIFDLMHKPSRLRSAIARDSLPRFNPLTDPRQRPRRSWLSK